MLPERSRRELVERKPKEKIINKNHEKVL